MNRICATLIPLLALLPLVGEPTASAIAAPLTKVRFNPAALPPPPNLGDASGRASGGRRGCQFAVLVPSVPTTQATTAKPTAANVQWGATTSAHPTFWVRLPNKLASNAIAELALRDDTNAVVHQSKVSLSATNTQIVSVPMPTTARPLQINQRYRWAITVYCDPGNSPTADISEATADFMTVRGFIQRIDSPDLQSQVANAKSPLEQAALYANRGIWFDALTVLGMSLQQQTSDRDALKSAWSDLLRQTNLGSP